MKNINDVSMGVLMLLFFLFLLEVYHFNKWDNGTDDNRSVPSLNSIVKSATSGAIRGVLMGLVLGGIEGAFTGAIVLAVINPIITGVEFWL